MVNVETSLQRYDIDTRCRLTAVAGINLFITNNPPEKQAQFADDMVYDVFGVHLNIDNPVLARLAAQYAVDAVSQNQYEVGNAPLLLEEAKAKAEAFYGNPNNAWMFATSESQSSFKTDSDAPKVPKKNKNSVATALYLQHIKNTPTPMTNGEFVDLLVKELDTTKSGARTFAYNAKKAAEETK